VIAADVIEHMVNPIETIDILMARLTNDGILIITTGDADNPLWNRFGANFWYCHFPEHVSFVSKAWFDHFAAENRWCVVRSDTFKHASSGSNRYLSVGLTYWYGWLPALYIAIIGMLKRITGRPGVTSVPGNGLSADHLLVVLGRRS
jgi:hypothetical protein